MPRSNSSCTIRRAMVGPRRILVAFVVASLAFGVTPAHGAAPSSAQPVPPALYRELRWRQLGPFRAGWATSVAGVAGDPLTYYFGAAGGGVWRTRDAGRTWQPLMQHERAAAVGALAIAPSNPRVVYVGTGQEGTRYDLMSGEGVYRSNDGGETWTHVGLEATREIGAILVDPRDKDRVLVAAIGHAFGPNPERGVYLTTDGGRRWQPVLQAGDSVGAVDLACDPTQPRIVYAAMWQMRMHPWLDYFQPQGGPGSGVYRSSDGGAHWTRLAGGLPQGRVGRIGLAVAGGSGGRIAYAAIAVDAGRARGADTAGVARRGGLYRTSDGGAHWEQVNADPSLGSSYFGRLTVAPDDANTVFVMGQSIQRSRDGGRHFEVMRGSPGGDDYHQLWIDPRDPRAMIAGSDQGAAVSLDGGATWSSWYNQPTGQFYHVAADDQFPYHVYSGQQDNGTVEIASRGPYGVVDGRDWHPVGGDERDYMVPMTGDPHTVFGSGLGGGVSRFDEDTRQSVNVSPWPIGSYGARPGTVRYHYGWITPLAISPMPPHAIYTGSQYLFRSRDRGDHWDVVSPDLSGKRADAAPCDDPDPAAARECGFGVISAIAPSPLAADLVWVGTDDGLIQLTRDGGRTWRDVTPPSLPAWGVVFAIDPSRFDARVAYAAVDLHRIDRREPLLLRTTDSGRTWQRIVRGIPADECTSVVRGDLGRPGLLYAGTDRGVYVSFDDGDSWQPLSQNLPTTWVRDLLPHGDDVIVATQGRGIWVLDDVTPLREASAAIAQRPVHLFQPAPAVRLRSSENHDTPWPPETALGENPPTGAVLDYWLADAAHEAVTLTITDAAGAIVRRFTSADPPESLGARRYFEREWTRAPRALAATPGMHRFVWDLRYARPWAPAYSYTIAAVRAEGTPIEPQGPFVLPGRYTVTLSANGVSSSRPLTVRLDPRVRVSEAALRGQLEVTRAAIAAMKRGMEASRDIGRMQDPRGADRNAIADSLRALAGAGGGGLRAATGNLAGLVRELEAADAAPTQGMKDAVRACAAEVDGLIRRWRHVEAMANTDK
ncbi:MAG TPA: hypothetical protein VFI79_09890 [Gemmatimonadales bacterium]|nr:hypothetical protein [Gemmatimonadales bacterium]